MASIDQIWAKYDTDNSGQLSRAEADKFFDEYYQVHEGSKISKEAKDQLFNIIDKSANHDGQISKEEFKSKLRMLFPQLSK